MSKPFIIGITGGSGSGKSYFLQKLVEGFSAKEVAVVSQDNYYHPIEKQALDARGVPNFDLPEAINAAAFLEDLQLLLSGKSIRRMEYTFNNPSAQPSMLEIHSAPVLVVEGIFLFNFETIVPLLDLKIFIEASQEIRLKRRLARDQTERGYAQDFIYYQHEYHVNPAYEQFLAPVRLQADVVIPNNGDLSMAFDLVRQYMKSKLGPKMKL